MKTWSALKRETAELLRLSPEEVAGHPREAHYYRHKAVRALLGGRYGEARRLVRKMLQCRPADDGLRALAASMYRCLGERAEAEEQLLIAIRLQPGDYSHYHDLAVLLLRRGERDAAAEVLEKGWSYRKRFLPWWNREAAMEEHFAPLRRYPRPLHIRPSNGRESEPTTLPHRHTGGA